MYTFHSKPINTNRNERVTFVGDFQNGILNIAAARCSKKDQFSRKKGTQIATGRLNKHRLVYSTPLKECSNNDFLNVVRDLTPTIIKSKIILLVK